MFTRFFPSMAKPAIRNRQARERPVTGSPIRQISRALSSVTSPALSRAPPTPPVTVASVMRPASPSWMAAKPESRSGHGWRMRADRISRPAADRGTRYIRSWTPGTFLPLVSSDIRHLSSRFPGVPAGGRDAYRNSVTERGSCDKRFAGISVKFEEKVPPALRSAGPAPPGGCRPGSAPRPGPAASGAAPPGARRCWGG